MWRAVVFVEGVGDARFVSDLLRDMGHANVIDGGRNIEPRLRLQHENAKENFVLVRAIGGVDNVIDSAKQPWRNMRFARRAQKAAAPAQSSPWLSLFLAAAGVVCFFALSLPLNILALSALLLLAWAWLPKGRTYTDMILGLAIRCYFLALAAWGVWRMVERL